ncbi:MAG: MFS transporter [Planctomycetota bacterium]|nr:MFS transporter [Planctomycetota bacterium]
MSGEASRWGVLRHRHFRIVFLASFGSSLGTWLEFVAIRWIVSQETKSETWMGYLAAAQLTPALILSLYAGLVADSVNRRTMLLVTQAFLMLVALAMAGLAWTDPANVHLWLLVTLAQGVGYAFSAPANQVLIPRLVPRDELTRAITLQGIQFNLARVLGPVLGGTLMGLFGAPTLLIFNACMFIAVMIAVSSTPDSPAPAEMSGKWKKPGEAVARVREAATWVFTRRGPRATLLAVVTFSLFATPVLNLLPLMISEVYGLEEDAFGLIVGAMGVGAVLGGFGMKLVPKWYPMHHFIPLSILLGGVWILLFSLMRSPWPAGVCMFFVGIFWMWSFSSCISAMQMLVPDAMRGRIMSVVNMTAMGLMPLGTFAASKIGSMGEWAVKRWLPEWWDKGVGTQIGLVGVSCVLLVAGLVMIIWRTPEIDDIEPGNPGYDRRPGLIRGIRATAHRPPRGD